MGFILSFGFFVDWYCLKTLSIWETATVPRSLSKLHSSIGSEPEPRSPHSNYNILLMTLRWFSLLPGCYSFPVYFDGVHAGPTGLTVLVKTHLSISIFLKTVSGHLHLITGRSSTNSQWHSFFKKIRFLYLSFNYLTSNTGYRIWKQL